MLLTACLLCALWTVSRGETWLKAPAHTVDLDLPPKQRWHFLTAYRPYAQAAQRYFAHYLNGWKAEVVDTLAAFVENQYGGELADELQGAADALQLDYGLLVMLNFLYELRGFNSTRPNETGGHTPPAAFRPQGACTSIVAQTHNGTLYHARNLDWNLPPKIRAMTFRCTFVKHGQPLFHGGCFAGFVGLLTGMRPGAFAVSLDERNLGGDPWLDLFNGLVLGALPVTHAIRQVLTEATDYASAVSQLSTLHIAAPAYFIVSGVKQHEGALLTRQRQSLEQPVYLSANKWNIIETNYDHWLNPPATDDRRAWAVYYMKTLGQKTFSLSPAKTLQANMRKWPVTNGFTAQNILMSAKLNLFEVYIVDNATVVYPPKL